ncbi:hypothetical protein [Telluria aromaticivorans]|uniref:GGDEF domain-containing protein n=1 Tax=Telluria aromaticivorans TaxID=2725995 RepID=A0A7Y2NX88_9BURK|nr:hypothetical protein [Telluria aromaticivorans]NNG21462.1 hypothetical protein [Telluria aromaticivorans]
MLDTAIDIDDMSVVVTIQAGVACNSGETASPDTMVRQANAALFHSTLSGASVTVFAIAAHRAYVARLTLMGDLRAPLNVTNCACIASPRLT